MTHFGWDNQEYICNQPCSVTGEQGKLWLIIRESMHEKLISVINLRGIDSDRWADGQNEPDASENVEITLQYFGRIRKAWYAAPDIHNGDLIPCRYEYSQNTRSQIMKILIPKISVYTFIWVCFDDTIE